MPGADAVIDFSSPAGTTVIAKRAQELGVLQCLAVCVQCVAVFV